MIPDGLVSADRVKQLSTGTGSGTLALGAAVSVKFTTAIAAGIALDTPFAYTIEHQGVGVGEWEVGYGRLVDASTLQRNTVTASSNAGALVNFSTGVKHVAITFTSDMLEDILASLEDAGTLSSVGLTTDSDIYDVGGSPLTSNGTLTFNKKTGLASNQAYMTPASGTGAIALRAIQNGDLPVISRANGGFGADMSASGGANFVVKQAAGGAFSSAALVEAEIPNLNASKINAGQLALARGGTNADLSATGAATHFLRQASAGAAVTVGAIVAADLPNHSAALLTSGDIAIARMQAALAAGGYPISATTGTFSGDVVMGTAFSPAPTGTPRATVYGAASSDAMVVRTHVTLPGDILQLQRADGANMVSVSAAGLLRFGPTTNQWPALKTINGGTAVSRLAIRAADDSGYAFFASGGAEVAYNSTLNASGAFGNAALSAYRVMINRADGGGVHLPSNGVNAWGSTTGNQFSEAADTGLSRLSAGVVAVGNGTAGNTSGTIAAALGQFTNLRINQAPIAATPTPTHTITINLNGTDYRIPCVI